MNWRRFSRATRSGRCSRSPSSLTTRSTDSRPGTLTAPRTSWCWPNECGSGCRRWSKGRTGQCFVGVLQNLPVGSHSRLEPGATIRVPSSWVIAIDAAPSVVMADDLAAGLNTRQWKMTGSGRCRSSRWTSWCSVVRRQRPTLRCPPDGPLRSTPTHEMTCGSTAIY